MTCQITVLENETIFEFPYIYYPGYKVTMNGEEIQNFESENGFLAISLPEISNAQICIEYVGTKAMFIAKIISVIGVIFMIMYLLFTKENDKMKIDKK